MAMSFIAGTVGGYVLGTLGEYVIHRLMHTGQVLKRRHARHHRLGFGQGVLGEFLDYAAGGVPAALGIGAVIAYPLRAPAAAGGFVCGAIAHMAFAAYSHQVQHERPWLAFWMRKPVHFLHHEHNLWHTNFGISTALWDHVFGTYEELAFVPERRDLRSSPRDFVRICWGTPYKGRPALRKAWEDEEAARHRAARRARRAAA